MEKQNKQGGVTLRTWEQGRMVERHNLPFTFAMAMAERGGFDKAQVIGPYDNIHFEFKPPTA